MAGIDKGEIVVSLGSKFAVILSLAVLLYVLAGCAGSIDNALRIRWGEKQVEENSEVKIQQKEVVIEKDVI